MPKGLEGFAKTSSEVSKVTDSVEGNEMDGIRTPDKRLRGVDLLFYSMEGVGFNEQNPASYRRLAEELNLDSNDPGLIKKVDKVMRKLTILLEESESEHRVGLATRDSRNPLYRYQKYKPKDIVGYFLKKKNPKAD